MSALARLVNASPVAPAVSSSQAARLDELRRCIAQLGDLSRNYGHISHERRQRHLVLVHTKLRDLHEAMANTATPSAALTP